MQGFAHENSDIDLYIISNENINIEGLYKVNETPQCIFYSGTIENHRLDVEVWAESAVKNALLRLAGIDNSIRVNNLGLFNEEEINFYNSLYSHRCVAGGSFLNCLIGQFDVKKFSDYLVTMSLLYAEDAYDDMLGMFKSGQYIQCICRARIFVEYMINAYLCKKNILKFSTKQIYKRIYLLNNESEIKFLSAAYRSLILHYADDEKSVRQIMKDVSRIYEYILDKLYMAEKSN